VLNAYKVLYAIYKTILMHPFFEIKRISKNPDIYAVAYILDINDCPYRLIEVLLSIFYDIKSEKESP